MNGDPGSNGPEWVDVPEWIWDGAVETGANIRVDPPCGGDYAEPVIREGE